MTDNNGKLRAVFLAALMVLWVFAGTMAFAGSAAATDSANVTVSSVTPADTTPDAQTTYDVTLTTDASTDVGSVVLDFSDAGGSGDVSQLSQSDVTYSVDGGSAQSINNLNVDGQTLEISIGQQTVNSQVTLYLGDGSEINNPDGGEYTLKATAYHEGSLQGNSDQSTTMYEIGTEFQQSGNDGTWQTGGSLRWQGQTLFFDNNSSNFPDLNDFQLAEWDGSSSTFSGAVSPIRELSLNDEGQATIRTSSLEGDYVITARDQNGDRVALTTNASGYVDGTVSTTGGSSDPSLTIAVQDLNTTFTDDEINRGDNTTVEVDSARSSFAMNVTSDSFTGAELAELFPAAQQVGDTDTAQFTGVTNEPDQLELNTSSDRLSFDLDTGNYTFNFDVTDTTASDDATVTVGEEVEGDANFDQNQYSTPRGDIVNITYTTTQLDTTTLHIGGADDGYNATIVVEPNDDGEVAVEMNTFTAAERGTYNLEDAFTATKGSIDVSESSQDSLNFAIESGVYDLEVTAGNQTQDLAALRVTSRSYDGFTVHTAPSSEFTRMQSKDRLFTRINNGWVTESEEIAVAPSNRGNRRGDVIVHKVDINGIQGYLEQEGGNAPLATMLQSQYFDLEVTQENPKQNRRPKQIAIQESANNGAFAFVEDPVNDSYYIVVKSDRLNFTRAKSPVGFGTSGKQKVSTGDEFNTTFRVTSDYEDEFIRGETDNITNYDEYEIVDREATFDTTNGNVTAEAVEGAEVTGDTTVAPGTELTIRVSSQSDGGESPIFQTSPVRVDSNGEFSAEFNFSSATEGQTFEASIASQSFEDNSLTPGVIVAGEMATVSISDQEFVGQADEIVVDSAFLPEGGFVTIHDGSILDGAVFDSVRGTSAYLSEGESTDVTVTLDTPYTESGTAVAMPHQDTNDNQAYDFVSSEGAEDSPYTADGEAVTASASVTITTPTETPTEDTETATETATESETETDTATPSEEQPGFGAVVALIALLGAALLAARRNAF